MGKDAAANSHLVAALADLFGQETKSDCSIQFYLEAPAADGDRGDEQAGGKVPLGPPLPAHSLILSLAAPERFGTQLDRWVESSPGDRPVLRVPLGSEAELPAAHLAIRFAYTGHIHASSVREALEVLRAGDYLAIEGCAAACSQWLADRVQEAPVANVGPSQPQAAAPDPPLLQLLACEDLWPSSDARFQEVMSAAKAHLVRYFSSTLEALNVPSLRQQLEALPAAALEALLESDDLGTDSEDSVLTLLATWMRANWARTDAATRKRLCDLVRLVQLSPSVTSCVLLSLAADFESKGPEHEAGWFPISRSKAALVSCYHACSPELQADMREGRSPIGTPAWLKAGPRAQGLPLGGVALPWNISRAALRTALEQLAQEGAPGEVENINKKVPAAFDGDQPYVLAGGYAWEAGVVAQRGKPNASVYLECRAPEAYKVPGSSLAKRTALFPAIFGGRLVAYRWRDGDQEMAGYDTYGEIRPMFVGAARVKADALPLVDTPVVLAAADPLAAWEPYLGSIGRIIGAVMLIDRKAERAAAKAAEARAAAVARAAMFAGAQQAAAQDDERGRAAMGNLRQLLAVLGAEEAPLAVIAPPPPPPPDN
ncbi:hypothetical protein HYH03_005745 [Edaphochlamys debaryana]|uniref:BACK domain-containing protein n=1 Tax=Edaphochlamys debaryana TaxID=47281 RepID=A0A835Y536_9CHLO|nr:hypothetical protein HYH03_005745 [Edaphochlamys debaryana]|eukprot:KAG2496143.1 hypothetical protein HYH03_005745 [Edaphochlamys debaryana]